MSRLFKAAVAENRQIIADHFLLTLHPLTKIVEPGPGNFFMLSTDSGLDPLLKRPFSLHRRVGGDFQILYRIAGKGTGILSKRKKGDVLDIVGPMGNGFPPARSRDKIILIAGGLGIAPIFALAEKLKKNKPMLFYGAKTGEEMLCLSELKELGIETVISTDDGTSGIKGFVTDILKGFLSRHASRITHHVLYACGPGPMLMALSALANKFSVKGHIALEQNMACGIGTCLGCVVNTKEGYKRVCKEGPVFPMEKIIWGEGMGENLRKESN
ncbi:MAG: dihydroorotate dehydrogenase electron transfer subunit [Nitrospirae bacterium]|nr:dihydroorotate dehydrogenase electron transfer subunit [Nitrospirota bacterium]